MKARPITLFLLTMVRNNEREINLLKKIIQLPLPPTLPRFRYLME